MMYGNLLRALCFVCSVWCGLSFRECEIDSSMNRHSPIKVLEASDKCMAGDIRWHYPAGELQISFPRAILGDDEQNKRVAMKVCLRHGIGEGVSNFTETRTNRKGREKRITKQLGPIDLMEKFVCTRRSTQTDGIHLTLNADTPTPMYYMKAFFYKIEKFERGARTKSRGKGKKGRRTKGRKYVIKQ